MGKQVILVLGVALVVAGCSSGGSSDSGTAQVTGLQIPSNFSVLTAKANNASGASASPHALSSSGLREGLAFNDPQTDYATDVAHINVSDESMGALGTVNEILCLLSQTGSSSMVNKGPYIALVNADKCSQGQSSAAQTGPSSGTTAANFQRWVIDSARPDNSSPQAVRIWMPNPGDNSSGAMQTILVQLLITDGVTDTNPFGKFRMKFRGVVDGADVGQAAGTEVAVMKGMLETVDNTGGTPQFRFVNLEGDALDASLQMGYAHIASANVRLGDAGGTTGLALTHKSETRSDQGVVSSDQRTYAVNYDATHFLSARDDDGDQVADVQSCRSRDLYDTKIWRYALYHHNDGSFRGTTVTAGARVALDSGFPFAYDSDGNGTNDIYGYIGSQGVWTESQQAPPDGQVVQRFDYSQQGAVMTPYTLRVSPGKLSRRTASHAPLSAFAGEQFSFWGQHPVLGIYHEWIVTVDGNLDLQLTSAVDNGPNGPVYSDVIDADNDPNTPPVPVATPLAPQANQVIWLWSQALGGSVSYLFDPNLTAAERQVTFFTQDTVGPDDGVIFPAGTTSVTLYCYDRCVIGGLMQADIDAAAGNEQALYHVYAGAPFTYTLASANGKVSLTDDANGQGVNLSALNVDALGHSWGVSSGEMLIAPLADPTQPWAVAEQSPTYHWETGANAWNRLVTAVNGSGAVAHFDQPLQLPYTHLTANDANGDATNNGKRFLLQYGGNGELGGIPGSQDDSGNWSPQFNLADGVVLSDATQSFLVRGLEQEQSMRVVDPANCASLDAAAAYSDTGLTLPTGADITDVSFTLADRPNISTAPAVIDGVVQQ